MEEVSERTPERRRVVRPAHQDGDEACPEPVEGEGKSLNARSIETFI